MSIRVMTAVFDHSEARLADRLVLLVIADRSDDDGSGCFRGVRSIAHMARVDERTVRRAIANLEQLGELEVERRQGQSSLYRVTTPNPGQDVRGNPGQSVRGPLAGCPRTPDRLPPNTSSYPSTRRGAESFAKEKGEPMTDHRGTFLPGTGWVQ